MIAYADTSFLCSIYREQEHSQIADAYYDSMEEPLFFTALLEFEFVQAIQLQVWLHSGDKTKGYSQREAEQMIADWEEDVAGGQNEIVPCDMNAVFRLARVYSQQRTSGGGHRTLDILHVATAVHLGAKIFLTFDNRQQVLAKYIGLQVPASFRAHRDSPRY